MAAERVIQCQDCGHHVITRMKNTKRCVVCRLVANMNWVQGRMFKCWRCEERFAPVARDDQACGKCAPVTGQNPLGTCSVCEQERPLLANEVAVCMGCARNPKERRKIITALERKQEARRAMDPGPEPQLGTTVTPAPGEVVL